MAERSGEWLPDRGDLIWLEFSPHSGHEQAGRRPGLVLSPSAYNAASSYALICPVTSRAKGYPFEVALPADSDVRGVILADQLRSLDWRSRHASLIGRVATATTDAVLARVMTLLE